MTFPPRTAYDAYDAACKAAYDAARAAFIDGFERNTPNPPKGLEGLYTFHYQRGVNASNMQSAASERATH